MCPAIPLRGQNDSVYSLAMNDSGTVLVAGGTDKVHVQCMSTHINVVGDLQWPLIRSLEIDLRVRTYSNAG